MNLYRSKGRHWTGTQADARAANDGDKNFEHIEVPTDKPGLIAFLNKMEERVLPAGAEALPPPAPFARAPVDEDFGPAPAISTRLAAAPTDPSDCPACTRSKAVAKRAANSQAAINIKADLEDVTDRASLMQIIEQAQLRLSEVIEKSVNAN